MSEIKIASANVQGLGNFQKRRDVFQYFRQKQFSIYFLQDTHFQTKLEKQIRAEWGYDCYFASHSSQSRGVCILFNNNFDFKVKRVIKDPQGNFLLISIQTMDREILLANIYGPNNDDPTFYIQLQKTIEDLHIPNIIIGGDWNLVMNPVLDYQNYKRNNNVKAQEIVNEMAGELELVDIWREINPETLRFTWRRNNPIQQSRLDFFLVSENTLSEVKDADIIAGYRSDHSIIVIQLEFKKETNHKNYWKFNSSLLKDKKFVDEIHKTIKAVKDQYSVLVYDWNNIESIHIGDLQLMISDQLFLDTLLMEIRKTTMDYSAKKKKTDVLLEKILEEEIQCLERIVDRSEDDILKMQEKKDALTNLRKTKVQGIILRSKARWAAEGEKVTKYFCNLEKRHYISKQMFKLISHNGQTLSNTDDMLEETREFYQNLYAEKEIEIEDLDTYTPSLPKLSKDEAEDLEGEITLNEATLSLKSMKNGKSPGTDGITVEFYKFFWKQIGSFVVRSLNEGFSKREMSISQREGVIICLPKGDKPREYLKNWRPISLLNVTYKIGSSCIANRIKKVLPNLINEDQTGFISGRYIGDNIRLLYDVINYLKENNLPGLLVSIDFEKAFDSVNWQYMQNVLKCFNFGENIQGWIQAFYTNIRSSVVVNGKASGFFSIKCGCRQGDPISPYLFILCAELLACRIRENQSIKGIQIAETEQKVSQFADDTSLFLEGDQKSYETLFDELNFFEKISGLKLNYEKTCNVWLGKLKSWDKQYLQNLKMTWNPAQFKILGLWFTNDLGGMAELNFLDKFNEVKKLFSIWSKRSNTPLGRIAVLKSLILSKLIYLWILLPNPPIQFIQQLQKKCFQFVWDNKNDKIKRTVAVQTITNGGINVPHIETYIKSLKLIWMKKILLDCQNPKWKQILQITSPEICLLEKYGPTLLLNNIHVNPFWKDVFKATIEFYDKTDIATPEELLMEPLFYNNKFKIDQSPFHFKDWSYNGIYFVKDIVHENGEFVSLQELGVRMEARVSMLDFFGCISSVKAVLRKKNIILEDTTCALQTKAYSTIRSASKGAKTFYNILIGNPVLPNACKNWERLLNKDIA